MKEIITNGKNLILLILVLFSVVMTIAYFRKPEVDSKIDYQKILSNNDSLKKVNKALEDLRTIHIQKAFKLRVSLDSLKQIRPKNIKQTNNEVSRLHNSTTAGKLLIIDSILRARR